MYACKRETDQECVSLPRNAGRLIGLHLYDAIHCESLNPLNLKIIDPETEGRKTRVPYSFSKTRVPLNDSNGCGRGLEFRLGKGFGFRCG